MIEYIYAGPHGSFVPEDVQRHSPLQAQAEFGFIVVQIDGMGTSNRSKAFHDVAWKNLGDAGFPDRILWHKAVAAKYPWYDITRVGIYGGSAGGQNALGGAPVPPGVLQGGGRVRGVPRQPDGQDLVERAVDGVADRPSSTPPRPTWTTRGGCRGSCCWWSASSTPTSIRRRRCRWRNALIHANKMFDLLVVPGANHAAGPVRRARGVRRAEAVRLLRPAPARAAAAGLEFDRRLKLDRD